MRRVAKKENMKKANLLAESLYKERLIEDYDYPGEEVAHSDKQYFNNDRDEALQKIRKMYQDKVVLWLDKFVSNDAVKAAIGNYSDIIEKNRVAGVSPDKTGEAIRNHFFQN